MNSKGGAVNSKGGAVNEEQPEEELWNGSIGGALN